MAPDKGLGSVKNTLAQGLRSPGSSNQDDDNSEESMPAAIPDEPQTIRVPWQTTSLIMALSFPSTPGGPRRLRLTGITAEMQGEIGKNRGCGLVHCDGVEWRCKHKAPPAQWLGSYSARDLVMLLGWIIL